MPKKSEVSDIAVEEERLGEPKKNTFFLSRAITLQLKDLDLNKCCCADVPCISIVKEYCESRSVFEVQVKVSRAMI